MPKEGWRVSGLTPPGSLAWGLLSYFVAANPTNQLCPISAISPRTAPAARRDGTCWYGNRLAHLDARPVLDEKTPNLLVT